MMVMLRFFASVRETVGASHEALTVPDHITTVGTLRQFLSARGDAWELALRPGRGVRMACDQVMCDEATLLHEGCEVAFFPPVTGG